MCARCLSEGSIIPEWAVSYKAQDVLAKENRRPRRRRVAVKAGPAIVRLLTVPVWVAFGSFAIADATKRSFRNLSLNQGTVCSLLFSASLFFWSHYYVTNKVTSLQRSKQHAKVAADTSVCMLCSLPA